MKNHTAIRAAAFALCVILVCGAAVLGMFTLHTAERIRIETDNIVGYVAADVWSQKPWVETISFQNMVSSDMTMLDKLYYDLGGDAMANTEKRVQNEIKRSFDALSGHINDQFGVENYGILENQNYYDFSLDLGYLEHFGYANISFNVNAMLADPALVTAYTVPNEERAEEVPVEEDVPVEEEVPEAFGTSGDEPGYQRYRAKNYLDAGVKDAYAALFAEQLEQIKITVVSAQEYELQYLSERMDEHGASYYIGNGDSSITNVPLGANGFPKDRSVFKSAPVYLSYTGGVWDGKPQKLIETAAYINQNTEYYLAGTSKPERYIAYDQTALARYAGYLTDLRTAIFRYLLPAVAALLLAFVLLIRLIVVTGMKREDGTRRLYAVDRIFVELQLAVLVAAAFGALFAVATFMSSQTTSRMVAPIEGGIMYNRPVVVNEISAWSYDFTVSLVLRVLICLLLSVLMLWVFLSLVRNLKARLFLKRSLIWQILRLCAWGLRQIRAGFDRKNPMTKTVLFILMLCVCTAFSVLLGAMILYGGWGLLFALPFCAVFVAALIISCRHAARYARLRQGVEALTRGDLSQLIFIPEHSNAEFDKLARMVNEIGAATDIAVQNELKQQRLKTELISNVSHDLKTPLTSIISYADLLSREGLRSKNAQQYLEIIEEKAARLQKLTEDLFDAAKASSGALNVRVEEVDLPALIRQAIAEMNGSLSELQLVINAEDNCFVAADRQLLWRVTDNLLNNVRKYAQPNSRVYIDLKELGNTNEAGANEAGARKGGMDYANTAIAPSVLLEIKNISGAPLNMPADELMERFKRGDESRATEGSGLGLAIARDLVRLQGGSFEITIDGDLFKTMITLPRYTGKG